MTDFRTSQTFAGIFADWDPSFRVSTFYVEVLQDANPAFRVSTFYIEVLADYDPTIRVTQYHLEVLYSKQEIELSGIMQSQGVDIFRKYVPVQYGERWRNEP